MSNAEEYIEMSNLELHRRAYDTLAEIIKTGDAERQQLRTKLALVRQHLRFIADHCQFDHVIRERAEQGLKETDYA